MRVFAVVLLILVGVVFVAAPAALLAKLTPSALNLTFWVCVIFAYYFLATIMPIDKIIGRFYPIFGAILIFMAVGITVMMFVSGTEFYNSAQWANQNPKACPSSRWCSSPLPAARCPASMPPSLRSWPAAWPMKSWASPCFTAAWWPKALSAWSGPPWA